MGDRFEDSPGLFGRGMGMSCGYRVTCAMCRKTYNADCGNDESDGCEGESVLYDDFAGLSVCEECMAAIEASVLHRIGDIIPWFARILRARKANFDGQVALLQALAGLELPGQAKEM